MLRVTTHRQQYQKIQRLSKNRLSLTTLALCMLPSLGFALGLGEIRTSSYLGEPLVAQIDMVNLPPNLDANSLLIRQVRSEEAKTLGVDIIANWQQIDFSFNPESSQYQVQVNSRKPIREPYINLLVEVVWPQGKLYREYTLFLDPAALSSKRANAAKSPARARSLTRQITSKQQHLAALIDENNQLRKRVLQLQSLEHLLQQQTALTQQQHNPLALNHRQATEPSTAIAQINATASAVLTAYRSSHSEAMASTLFATAQSLRPPVNTPQLNEKFWALVFNGSALGLLLGFSLTRSLRNKKSSRLSYAQPRPCSQSSTHDYTHSHPGKQTQRTDEEETTQNLSTETMDEIDEMLLDLELEPSVKERLQQELAEPLVSLCSLEAPEKEARDQLVQSHIQEKVSHYNRDSPNTHKKEQMLEEIPIDAEMEAYLKL